MSDWQSQWLAAIRALTATPEDAAEYLDRRLRFTTEVARALSHDDRARDSLVLDVLAGDERHTLDENLFCPITEGTFAGEDCRDTLELAIEWWDRQLRDIDQELVHLRLADCRPDQGEPTTE